ncbi:MAG: hypothetical protein ACYCWW_03670 [Deltaproteobacteria bacterium]
MFKQIALIVSMSLPLFGATAFAMPTSQTPAVHTQPRQTRRTQKAQKMSRRIRPTRRTVAPPVKK